MTRIWLVIGMVAMYGCGGFRRHLDPTPVQPLRSEDAPLIAERRELPAVPPPPVYVPPPSSVDPIPAAEPPRPGLPESITAINGRLEDAYFAYDHFDLSPEATAALAHDADLLRAILRDFPDLQIAVEGHCDERGSAEYNLGLGDRRAMRALDFLFGLGLPHANFAPVSYGKEAPQCLESSESCWRLNRRAHLVVRAPHTD